MLMHSLDFAVLVCVITGRVTAVNIAAACDDTDRCTLTNSYCRYDFSNCNKGVCACKSGYQPKSDNTACLTEKGIDDTCTANTFCKYDAECSGSNQCQCASGKTYNSKLKLCITTGMKAISEECSAETECMGYSATTADNMVKCEAATGSNTKYCRCLAGLITESYSCRKPHVDEVCTSAIGCTVSYDLSDSSQETETCQSNSCVCPTTSDEVFLTYQDVNRKYCYTKNTNKKADGATCSVNNECTSEFCSTCPGESTDKCLNTTNGVMKVEASSLHLMLVVALAAMLFQKE